MRTISALPVREDWIDYNGHLNEGYYVVVFGFATDALMVHVGLGDEYRRRTGHSLYTVEAHVRYLREVAAGAELDVTTRLIGHGAKKLRLCHEMAVGETVVATEEILALHVDTAAGASLPFPDDVAANVERLLEPTPDYAGRSVTG